MTSSKFQVSGSRFGGELHQSWLTNLRFRVQALETDRLAADGEAPTSEHEVRSTKYEIRGTSNEKRAALWE